MSDRRKVWFSETLALELGASLVEWGEPDADGFYNPELARVGPDVHCTCRCYGCLSSEHRVGPEGGTIDPTAQYTVGNRGPERIARLYAPAEGLRFDDEGTLVE